MGDQGSIQIVQRHPRPDHGHVVCRCRSRRCGSSARTAPPPRLPPGCRPESPVPDPRGVSGTPREPASFTMAATSTVDPGRTTARGRMGVAVNAAAWVSSSLTPTPVLWLAVPTMSANRYSRIGADPPDRALAVTAVPKAIAASPTPWSTQLRRAIACCHEAYRRVGRLRF
jgi:hypothetical protein